MKKSKELKEVAELLRNLATLVDEIVEENKTKSKKAAEPVKEEDDEPYEVVTLADVRAVLAEKSREGKTHEVKALIRKYGAEKLSEVDPEKYNALKAEAEVL